MKYNYLLSLALLLLGCLSYGVSARASQHQALNRDEILDGAGRLRPNFINLNFDVLFTIFDEFLDLIDLMSVASTNSRVASIANQIFRKKYGDYDFVVRDHFSLWGRDERSFSITDSPTKRIQIANSILALGMLRAFGTSIQTLSIDQKFTKEILENIRTPFEQVESIRIDFNEEVSDILPFDQLFPKLKDIKIYLESNVGFRMVDCAFPHIEYLSIHVWNDAWNQSKSIEGLIHKNPQVKGIEIYGFPSDYIKVINEAMPTLENVTLFGFSTGNETVTLENVKKVVLHGERIFHGSPGDIEYLSCPRLEFAKFDYSPNVSDKLAIFLNNHRHLEKLHMNYCPFNQLVAVTANLTNLKEITMHLNDFESFEEIREFLQSHPTLMKAHFSTSDHFDRSQIQFFCGSLGDEWNFEDFTKYDDCYIEYNFVLSRKNSTLLQ